MRIANLIRLTLLALTLSLIGAPAASALPSGAATIQKADAASVQRVGYYGDYYRRGYNNCYRPYHNHYRSYSYSRDYYRPQRRYYRNDYSDYSSSSYSYYRRPRYRSYDDYDY
jgi:hypothetical protein